MLIKQERTGEPVGMIQRAKLNFYDCVLRPNPSRTVVRPFDPHYPRDFAGGTSRAQETVDLIVALDEVELARQLKGVTLSLDENHRDVDTMLLRRFEEVAGGIEGVGRINAKQRRLIGAYFSEEFAYEAAALFNPSVVLHPEQSGLPEGTCTATSQLKGQRHRR